MNILEIYKILYNAEYGNCSVPFNEESKCKDTCDHSKAFLAQQKRESEFHSKLWHLLSVSNSEYIPANLLKDILVQLYSSSFTPNIILIDQIKAAIRSHKDSEYFEADSAVAQLLVSFKELNPAPFFVIKAFLLKPRKPVKAEVYSFSPSINPKSQALDEKHLRKYIDLSFNANENFSLPCTLSYYPSQCYIAHCHPEQGAFKQFDDAEHDISQGAAERADSANARPQEEESGQDQRSQRREKAGRDEGVHL
eukprot:TRINITY_DN3865_c0_g1_i2.p1 TRINITY_DN3865_c0_g1~~TRINITY_DN3865_c0_g1_i2.p1  ORF type:complete len:252 (+),score=35.24 TRINITY_DN3865_c0_g1_i2:893-1648(+)